MMLWEIQNTLRHNPPSDIVGFPIEEISRSQAESELFSLREAYTISVAVYTASTLKKGKPTS
jgi:hypothetical protein